MMDSFPLEALLCLVSPLIVVLFVAWALDNLTSILDGCAWLLVVLASGSCYLPLSLLAGGSAGLLLTVFLMACVGLIMRVILRMKNDYSRH